MKVDIQTKYYRFEQYWGFEIEMGHALTQNYGTEDAESSQSAYRLQVFLPVVS